MRRSLWLLLIPALLVGWGAVEFLSEPAPNLPGLAYSDLVKEISRGEVRDLTLSGRAVNGMMHSGRIFQSYLPTDANDLMERALDAGVHVIARPEPQANPWLHYALAWGPSLFWLWAFRSISLRLINSATDAQSARMAALESRLAALESRRV